MGQFRLLGEVGVPAGDESVPVRGPRQQSLLAVLLLEANRPVASDQLIDRVWGTARRPTRPANALQTQVTLLRRVLEPAGDVSIDRQSPSGYRLSVDEHRVDVHRFRWLVDQARDAEEDRATSLLVEALGLWRGKPFEGLDTPWLEAARATLVREQFAARLRFTDLQLGAGQHAALLPGLTDFSDEHPFDEHVAGQLMLALYRSGRPSEALEHFQRIRHRLNDELGTDPTPTLRDLHQRILLGDPVLDHATAGITQRAAGKPAALNGEQVEQVESVALAEVPEAAPDVESPGPVTRSRRPRIQLAMVLLGLAVALIASLLVIDRSLPGETGQPDRSPASPVVQAPAAAADRYGWGSPAHSAEFDTGLDGWTVAGPKPGRDGVGRQTPGQVTVNGGVATITGLANGDTGYLRRLPGSLHGRWEARVRLPPGCACYRPLLTLWPDSEGDLPGSEIVYLEVFDPHRQTAKFFLYTAGGGRLADQRQVDLTAWNNFAVEWTGDHLTGYLNGEPWFHTTRSEVLPSHAMHPTIKLDRVASDSAASTATMEVDWIKEYRL
ncbi:BTAD domain-containing putative transcriptional regulator [Amycolatopsis nigrescens]|uniref:BTAD domain-containing putative transcriptional regulator n=1 Tax=Amycolatopsis nigrescens TaxID=381445 RepID=UPI000370E514|nr:BTAD domain-containing putative transcriptional regulator [Amycolatopsis nigrescens]